MKKVPVLPSPPPQLDHEGFKALGLSTAERKIMISIWNTVGKSLAHIARESGQPTSSTAYCLKRLKARGLVACARPFGNPKDYWRSNLPQAARAIARLSPRSAQLYPPPPLSLSAAPLR
jgi:hypothetical protein